MGMGMACHVILVGEAGCIAMPCTESHVYVLNSFTSRKQVAGSR